MEASQVPQAAPANQPEQKTVPISRTQTRKIMQRCCGLNIAIMTLNDPSVSAVGQLAGFIAAKRILEGELAKATNTLINLVIVDLAEADIDMTQYTLLAWNYETEEVILANREPGQ